MFVQTFALSESDYVIYLYELQMIKKTFNVILLLLNQVEILHVSKLT